MAMAISLAAMQAPAAVPEPPRRRVGSVHGYVSPTDVTDPLLDLRCQVVDRQRNWHRLELGVSGGRGYARSGRTDATRRVMTVRSDEGGVIGGLPFLLMDDSGARFGRAPAPQVFVEPASRWQRTYDRIAIHAVPDGRSFVGFCDVTETPQLPLSAEEAERMTQ